MTPIIQLIGYAIAAGFLSILGFWLIWLTEAFLEEKAPPFSRLTPCAGRILTSWEATIIAFGWRMIMSSRRAHPGIILWEEFMKPDGITVAELAGALDVPDTHIQAIIDQRCDICDKMAIRMAQHFNTSQLFWSQLQLACDQAGSQGKPYC